MNSLAPPTHNYLIDLSPGTERTVLVPADATAARLIIAVPSGETLHCVYTSAQASARLIIEWGGDDLIKR